MRGERACVCVRVGAVTTCGAWVEPKTCLVLGLQAPGEAAWRVLLWGARTQAWWGAGWAADKFLNRSTSAWQGAPGKGPARTARPPAFPVSLVHWGWPPGASGGLSLPQPEKRPAVAGGRKSFF